MPEGPSPTEESAGERPWSQPRYNPTPVSQMSMITSLRMPQFTGSGGKLQDEGGISDDFRRVVYPFWGFEEAIRVRMSANPVS